MEYDLMEYDILLAHYKINQGSHDIPYLYIHNYGTMHIVSCNKGQAHDKPHALPTYKFLTPLLTKSLSFQQAKLPYQ